MKIPSGKLHEFNCMLAALIFSAVATCPLHAQTLKSEQSPSVSRAAPHAPGDLPPVPPGKKTVLGGAIRDVDPVRDQFKLVPVGGHPIVILYDARTRFYRNGVQISDLDLRPEEHASVETTLDGTNIFAVSVHALTHLPGGVCRGQVLSYDATTGRLKVNSSLSSRPIEMHVPQGTPEEMVGQEATSALSPAHPTLAAGDLVEVEFRPGSKGTAVATHVSILATPGHRFVFAGKLVMLDMNKGAMTILNSADHRNYDVIFYPAQFPDSAKLREGRRVRVTTRFDGVSYVADGITIE